MQHRRSVKVPSGAIGHDGRCGVGMSDGRGDRKGWGFGAEEARFG